jgi:hypothetical protein
MHKIMHFAKKYFDIFWTKIRFITGGGHFDPPPMSDVGGRQSNAVLRAFTNPRVSGAPHPPA